MLLHLSFVWKWGLTHPHAAHLRRKTGCRLFARLERAASSRANPKEETSIPCPPGCLTSSGLHRIPGALASSLLKPLNAVQSRPARRWRAVFSVVLFAGSGGSGAPLTEMPFDAIKLVSRAKDSGRRGPSSASRIGRALYHENRALDTGRRSHPPFPLFFLFFLGACAPSPVCRCRRSRNGRFRRRGRACDSPSFSSLFFPFW